MILPSKHIPEEQTLLGVGAVVLRYLEHPQSVTGLWNKLRDERTVGTYERFVLALDLLFITGVIILSQGLINRRES